MSCLDPYLVVNTLGEKVPVGCGRCPICLKKKANQWAFRLEQEDKVATSGYFVTLTYRPGRVPKCPKGRNTLDKEDYQKYMKRLRHREGKGIRYYAVGEYGDKYMRPHYHAIMFNVKDRENIFNAWTENDKSIGHVHVGYVTGSSIQYTCKYLHKAKKVPQYKGDTRQREFSLMSKGIGANYLTDQMIKYHKDDLTRNRVRFANGVTVAMPKYYRDTIFTEDERTEQGRLIELHKLQKEEKEFWHWWNTYGVRNLPIDFSTYMEVKRIGISDKFINKLRTVDVRSNLLTNEEIQNRLQLSGIQ